MILYVLLRLLSWFLLILLIRKSSFVITRQHRTDFLSEQMHCTFLPVFFLLSIAPQYILAANDGNQNTRKQEVTAMAQVALPLIANGLHDRYRKTLGTMNYHHQKFTAIDKRIAAMDRDVDHLFEHGLPWLRDRETWMAKAALKRKIKEVEDVREKHAHHWRKASEAAGAQKSANRLIYDTMPEHVKKGIGRPDDTPQKALQHVGKYLQKTWVTAVKSSQNHRDLSEDAAKEVDRLQKARVKGKLMRYEDKHQFMRMAIKQEAHETAMEKDASAAMRALYANRVLALTIKGIDPIKLQVQEQWALKRSGEYAKAHPWLPWDVTGHGRIPIRNGIVKDVRKFFQP